MARIDSTAAARKSSALRSVHFRLVTDASRVQQQPVVSCALVTLGYAVLPRA
jgi:hypothetical protein